MTSARVSEYKELCERMRAWDDAPDGATAEGAVPDMMLAADYIERLQRERDEAQKRAEIAEDALAENPILSDKDLVAAVITVVMNGQQSERDKACLKIQKHIMAVENERDARESECETLSERVGMAEHTLTEARVERDALRAQLAAAEQDAVGLAKAIERGGFCLAEMMQAYERRIRSDCKSPDELEKRPWECAEYIAASSYLRTMFPIRDAALAQASPDEQKGGGE